VTATDTEALNQARIEARLLEWMRAGRELYKAHAKGVTSIDPADIITRAEETKCPSQ
jgi:hypothetical protein